MINEWDDLLIHLNIDENTVSDNDVLGLLSWCRVNISTGKEFSSNPTYNEIKQYVTHYFETVSACKTDELLQTKPEFNELNAIQYASFQGYDQYLEKVLSQHENSQSIINATTNAGMASLHFAVLNGHKETTKVLINYGADAHMVNKHQQTILHLALTALPRSTDAILSRKLSLFTYLKKTFPELVELADISGDTIVHIMSKNGFTNEVMALGHENRALLQKKNKFGCSALHMAILNNHFETAKVLTVIPDLVTISDSDGKRPVHYAAFYADAPLLKLVLNPDKMDITDYFLKTPLHFAAAAGNVQSVTLLASFGANFLLKDLRELSIIHHSVSSKNLELVQWILANTDVKINELDQLGRTALIVLFANNMLFDANMEALINYLISKGADLSIRDRSGRTVKDYALQLTTKGGRINEALYNKITQENH